MKQGKFIVFEGCEGSGKTKHVELFVEHLKRRGLHVSQTHEPGGTKIGQMIRDVILFDDGEKVCPRAELFLFLADRAHHVDTVIRPALARGETVVCDRFSGSTYAYQIGARQLDNGDFIKQMDEYARDHLTPDIVVYLDIEPAEGLERKDRGDLNRLDNEKLEFHSRVRDFFLDYSQQHDNWVTISTTGDKGKNADIIYQTIIDKIEI